MRGLWARASVELKFPPQRHETLLAESQPSDLAPRPWTKSANRDVAQVSNLLYRRFPISNMFSSPALSANSKRVQAGSTAIQQVGNLRYDLSTALLRARCVK